MKAPTSLHWIIGLLLAVLFVSGCGQATPIVVVVTNTPPPVTATSVPPADTATSVPPTAMATPVPPTATNTVAPTAAPSDTPTIEPPTATSIPPTATRVPPTATRKPTSVPTVRPATKPPVAANPCNLQAGQTGIIMVNTHNFEVKLTIGGGEWGTHDYFFPANSTTPIQFPPGKYTATLNVPGQGNYRFAADRIDFQSGQCYRFTSP